MKRSVAVLAFFAFLTGTFTLSAQLEAPSDSLPTQVLGEVVVQGRIAESYVNESKSVTVYSAEAIAQSGAAPRRFFAAGSGARRAQKRSGAHPSRSQFTRRHL
jgi:hypothetical protein